MSQLLKSEKPKVQSSFKDNILCADLAVMELRCLTLPSLGGGASRPAVNFRCLYSKNEKC